MSIKLTTQMNWEKYAFRSKYHPDNMSRPTDLALPSAPIGPAPVTHITDMDRQISGGVAWGHRLCCERAYGPNETTTRIKGDVTSKVGGSWNKTKHIESASTPISSAMYSGSYIDRSCCDLVNSGIRF